jgi:two-component system, NarL family, sensor histidine kinase UhpB
MTSSGAKRLQRAFLDTVPDMAWLKDKASRYEAVNAAYLKSCGRTETEIIGKSPREVWPAEVAEVYLRTDRAVLRSGEGRRYEEARVLADGTLHWFDTIKSPVRDDQGRIVGTVGISRDITARKAAEAELVQSRARLRELSSFLETVREKERARIARELHDELGQTLTSLKLGLGALRDANGLDHRTLCGRIEAMMEIVDAAVVDLRRIASDLRPLMLDELGLAAAVEWLASSFGARTGIAVKLSVGRLGEVGPETSSAAFRILQECLTNVARHAAATTVRITVSEHNGLLDLVVCDDGRGMPPTAQPRKKTFGLLGMEERALGLGGSLRVESEPGRGTTIEVRLPTRTGDKVPGAGP